MDHLEGRGGQVAPFFAEPGGGDGLAHRFSPIACLPLLWWVHGIVGHDAIRGVDREQWAWIELLPPSTKGKQSQPFRDHRQMLNGIIYPVPHGLSVA